MPDEKKETELVIKINIDAGELVETLKKIKQLIEQTLAFHVEINNPVLRYEAYRPVKEFERDEFNCPIQSRE